MSVKKALEKVLEALPEEKLREVLDFAEFLSGRAERAAWQQFGQAKIARAYGQDEPDYTTADLLKIEAKRKPPSLAEWLGPVVGMAETLPEDLAQNHDHYLYGLPKKANPSVEENP
jgi:hypothetical protein